MRKLLVSTKNNENVLKAEEGGGNVSNASTSPRKTIPEIP
jgi:hypothetical protein